MSGCLRIATRRSKLALWQANHVRDLLATAHPGLEIELLPMVTRGDRIIDRPLAEIGGKGLFLKELELAMLEGEADLAVHSMKDMPAEMTPGLAMEVALPRANPFDALLMHGRASLDALPPGSTIGTSSLRRQCQLRALRPDLRVESLRGNVDTRLRKLQNGDYDAIILACAGLERLGLAEHITQVLGPPDWLPAATQGIIGLQSRADDPVTLELIQPLNDAEAMAAALAERAVTQALQGSCQVPLAAYSALAGGRIALSAMVGTPDGRRVLRAEGEGAVADAARVGSGVAQQLAEQGALDIIENIR